MRKRTIFPIHMTYNAFLFDGISFKCIFCCCCCFDLANFDVMPINRTFVYSKRAAQMSSLLGLLLEPLLGGVCKLGGGLSKYDKSSMGSTTLSGSSCKISKKKKNFVMNDKIKKNVAHIISAMEIVDLHSNHLYCYRQ